MDNLRHYIKAFLTFTKWEQRGIFALVVLIAAIMTFNLAYKPKVRIVEKKDISEKIEAYEARVKASERILAEQRRRNKSYKKVYRDRNGYSPRPNNRSDAITKFFIFDPNKISKDSLMKLGFSQKQANAIANYRSKGGAFRAPDDFGKMYVVDAKLFELLKPYIQIASVKSGTKAQISEFCPVDINTSDTTALKTVRGIGSILAKKIVQYRDRLGGYADYDQLLEISGIDAEQLALIKKQLLPLSPHKRIRVNAATADELKKHPYITSYEARNIVYYRMKQGLIDSPEQLLSAKLVDKKRFEKLKVYIDCTK